MNDQQLSQALTQLVTDRKREAPSAGLAKRVWAIPERTDHERDWQPRWAAWRSQAIFSATKYLVAGVLLSLAGGALLAGLVEQPSDVSLPAASVSASHARTASPEASPQVSPVEQARQSDIRQDILLGVPLEVERLRPRVVRVLGDGVHDLESVPFTSVISGHDGSVWLMEHGQSAFGAQRSRGASAIRLGQPGTVERPLMIDEMHVAPDGSAYVLSATATPSISRFDGKGWELLWTWSGGAQGVDLDVTTSGSIYALVPAEKRGSQVVRLVSGEWQAVTQRSGVPNIFVTDAGELWSPFNARRYDHGEWVRDRHWARHATVGRDGTVWLYGPQDLQRHGIERLERWADGDVRECALEDMPNGFRPSVAARDGSLWGTFVTREVEVSDGISSYPVAVWSVAWTDCSDWRVYREIRGIYPTGAVSADGTIWWLVIPTQVYVDGLELPSSEQSDVRNFPRKLYAILPAATEPARAN